MSIRIRIEHGQDAGKTMRLGRPGVYVLGRHPSASMRVLDMKVSKAHCEVHVGDNGMSAMLRDLGSTHGCQVNGQPVAKDVGLNPGDELRLGLTILRVLSDGAADEELQPSKERDLDEASVESSSTEVRKQGVDTSSAAKLPPDELVGKDLGGYKIEQKIGKGGMGAVYLAEQVSLKRKVALKVLSEKFVKDSAFVDQFLNEARSAGALNHPNVVQVYDVGDQDGHYFFSMEFVSGGSIEEILDKKPGQWKEALNWFLDATNALVFANKRDILHRDVKPDNLMVSEDGSAKLCDLGLAKRSENDDLMSQGIIGTPHFISPEAIRRKTAIDHRTDLYSLGCTFFRILSGKNPYPGKTVKEILLGHLNKPVPHVTDHVKSVPPALDEIVHKLMAKDPDERFQTPDELLVALDKVRLQHGLEEHGIKPKSRKPIIIGAALLLAVAATAIIYLVSQDPETQVVDNTEDMTVEKARLEIGKLGGLIDSTLTQARGELVDLNGRRQQSKITETWETAKSTHEKIAGDYDAKAKAWRTKIDELTKNKSSRLVPQTEKVKKRAAAEPSPELDALLKDYGKLSKKFDDANTKLGTYAGEAEKAATAIRDYVKARFDLKSDAETGHDKAIEDITAKLVAVTKELDAHLANGEFLELEEKLSRAKIDEMLKPIVEGAVLEHKLIGRLELLRPTLLATKPGEKNKPGEVDELITKFLGDPLGEKKWIDPALKQLKKNFDTAWGAAEKARNDNKAAPDNGGGPVRNPKPVDTHEGYRAALEILEAFLDSLPIDRGGTGRIATRINEQRAAVEGLRSRLRKADIELGYDDLRHDKQAYFELLVDLYHPITGYDDINIGMFHLLDGTVLSSVTAKANQIAADMRTDEYREITEMWARDASALAALLQHLKASYDKGWSKKTIEIEEENGKVSKKKPKEISLSGITFGRDDETRFRDLGPLTLINSVLYYRGEPRFEFTPDDLRGIAILGELAGNLEAAEKHYIQYKAVLVAPQNATEIGDVSRRLNGLIAEMQAAKAWYRAHEVERALNTFRAECDPQKIGLGKFDEAVREKIVVEFKRLNDMLYEANVGIDQLKSDKKLAGTAWGSALRREIPHPEVAYANEKLPPPTDTGKKPNPPAPPPGPAAGNPPGDNKPGDDKPK